MSSARVSVEGLGGLVDGTRALADYLRDGAPDGSAAAAQLVAGRAAETAPRDTGALAASTSAQGVAVVSAVPYARQVHARDPYVSRAWEELLPRVVDTLDDDIQQRLDTI